VLRLLCLCSLVNNGVRRHDALRSLLAQVHGPGALATVHNLERLGLLKKQESATSGITGLSSQIAAASISVAAAGSIAANLVAEKVTAVTGWDALRRRLNLVVDASEEERDGDVSYAYSGYAPISARLVERAVRPPPQGWASLEESLKILPGPLFQRTQEPKRRPGPWDITPPVCGAQSKPRRVVLVMFVGGVTFSEVSALRFLSRQQQGGASIVVATTKLTSGEALIGTLCDTLEARPPPGAGAGARR